MGGIVARCPICGAPNGTCGEQPLTVPPVQFLEAPKVRPMTPERQARRDRLDARRARLEAR